MTSHSNQPDQPNREGLGVLVGYDASPSAGHALRWAAGEALRRGLPLTVLHAVDLGLDVDPTAASVEGWSGQLMDAARAVADDGARQAGEVAHGVHIRGLVGTGPASRVLVEQSRDAELVVVGNRGRSELASAWLGSVSMAVATHAHCPTVVVRNEPRAQVGAEHAVVVGVDGSDASMAAVDAAAQLAQNTGATVRVVGAWDPLVERDWGPVYASALPGGSYGIDDALRTAAREAVAAAADRVRGAYPGTQVTTETPEGPPARALVDAASDAGILVVGSRGHGAFAGLVLGSVSHELVHTAPCPVMVVHGPVAVRSTEETAPVHVMI